MTALTIQPIPEHLAECRECGSLFELPAVGICPHCDSNKVRGVSLERRLAHELEWALRSLERGALITPTVRVRIAAARELAGKAGA